MVDFNKLANSCQRHLFCVVDILLYLIYCKCLELKEEKLLCLVILIFKSIILRTRVLRSQMLHAVLFSILSSWCILFSPSLTQFQFFQHASNVPDLKKNLKRRYADDMLLNVHAYSPDAPLPCRHSCITQHDITCVHAHACKQQDASTCFHMIQLCTCTCLCVRI